MKWLLSLILILGLIGCQKHNDKDIPEVKDNSKKDTIDKKENLNKNKMIKMLKLSEKINVCDLYTQEQKSDSILKKESDQLHLRLNEIKAAIHNIDVSDPKFYESMEKLISLLDYERKFIFDSSYVNETYLENWFEALIKINSNIFVDSISNTDLVYKDCLIAIREDMKGERLFYNDLQNLLVANVEYIKLVKSKRVEHHYHLLKCVGFADMYDMIEDIRKNGFLVEKNQDFVEKSNVFFNLFDRYLKIRPSDKEQLLFKSLNEMYLRGEEDVMNSLDYDVKLISLFFQTKLFRKLDIEKKGSLSDLFKTSGEDE